MCCYYLVKHVGAELRCAYQVTRMTRKSDRLTEVRTARDSTGDYVRLVGDGGSFDVEEHHFTKTTRTARYAYGEGKPVVGEMFCACMMPKFSSRKRFCPDSRYVMRMMGFFVL